MDKGGTDEAGPRYTDAEGRALITQERERTAVFRNFRQTNSLS